MPNKLLGINIDEIIRKVLVETFPKTEKELQAQKAEKLKDFKKEQQETKDEKADIDEDKKTSVKAAEIVDLFNLMRSGKSLKDPGVRKSFQAYFDSLTGSERLALFAYAKAIADIINSTADETEAADQEEPEDYGVEVKKFKKRKKKVNKDGKDDSAPIVVGEVANKSAESRILKNLKWRLQKDN